MTLAHGHVINVLGRRIERARHRFPRVGYDVKPVLHPIRQELIRSRCLGIEFPDRGYLIVDPEIRARRDGIEFFDRGYLIADPEIRARRDGIEFFDRGYLIAGPEIRARCDGIEFMAAGYVIRATICRQTVPEIRAGRMRP